MGSGLGGLLTFLTAARTRVDAAVAFDGGRTEEFLSEAPDVDAPMQMHLAEKNEFMTRAAQQQIIKALAENPRVEIHTYPGCRGALSRQGIARALEFYAYDHRGRGKSEGPRLFISDIAEYTDDLGTFIGLVKSREPGLKVLLLGHSMGGVISCAGTLDHQAEIAGFICESFAFEVWAPKPVLSLVMPEFAGGQENTLHFHYLRAANGGLLEEAAGFDQHLEQLAAALCGTGRDGRIRSFIERFVRPRGINTPVTPIMADEIERAAKISKRRHRPAPWHYLVRGMMRAGLTLRGR
jgi:pimeloyl-ACP methyl ester carboxylesterase